jgi:hypothetical protein
MFTIDTDRKVLELKKYAKKMGNLNLIVNIQDATKLIRIIFSIRSQPFLQLNTYFLWRMVIQGLSQK